jgi:hypothetical protein
MGAGGLLLGAVSIGLTLYLWFRSGPHLQVTVFVRAETSSIHIEVANSGRTPATVKNIELRDHLVLRVAGGTSGGQTAPAHRWTIRALPNAAKLPHELAPSAFVDCDVEARAAMEKAGDAAEVTVSAWAQRGDGKWYSSRPVRVR